MFRGIMVHTRIYRFQYACGAALACAAMAIAHAAPPQAPQQQPAATAAAAQGPDLDLSIHYYSRVLTPEGVLRESRYQEKMMRRSNHVWTVRVLPDARPARRADAALSHKEHEHKHFNHVMLPRHVLHANGQVRLEFVDVRERQVVAIPPGEYENVRFDGSWTNAFFLLDPKKAAALPATNRASPVAGARWREIEKDGMYQRILWDEKRMIPLVIEKGDVAGRTLERMEITPRAGLASELPWTGIKGYAQKEYADFLD
jgi:hypothetical protein